MDEFYKWAKCEKCKIEGYADMKEFKGLCFDCEGDDKHE